MLAVLKLEFIAENYHAYKRVQKAPERPWHQPLVTGGMERYGGYLGRNQSRPWVARLAGIDEQQRFTREFVSGQIDYSHANSTGSRGVYLYYPLKDGLYEVNARETWSKARRYFLRVEQTQMVEIEREEVLQCLIEANKV